MLNNQCAQLILPPEVSEPNEDSASTGDPNVDFVLDMIQEQVANNFRRVASDMRGVRQWAEMLASAFERYAADNNRVVNGQIEFPTPGSIDPTGNIKCSYVDLNIPTTGVGYNVLSPFAVVHGYGDGVQGQPPRGWFQMANSNGAFGARMYDQILSSAYNIVYGVTADTAATTTVTSTTTITGTAGTWITAGVQAGDLIKLSSATAGGLAAGVNGTCSAGSREITLSAAPAVTPVAGWMVRFVGADNGLRQVLSYNPSTLVLTVGTPYPVALAAVAGTWYPVENSWLEITSLTATVLTLASPGTLLPTVATWAAGTFDYTIRRPPDSTYAWVRVLNTTSVPFETTVCFF